LRLRIAVDYYIFVGDAFKLIRPEIKNERFFQGTLRSICESHIACLEKYSGFGIDYTYDIGAVEMMLVGAGIEELNNEFNPRIAQLRKK
jgi:hypothetical protein